MKIKQNELRTTREVARELASCVDALREGDVEKIVIVKGSDAQAVMVSPQTFERLIGDDA